jgi:hypothetical protein
MTKFCENCGREISSAKFCSGCGAAAERVKKSSRVQGGCLLLAICAVLLWSFKGLLPTPAPERITYSVAGTETLASLTYQNESGGTEQRDVAVPWKLELTATHGAFLYLAAQKHNRFGTIRVAILVNGQTLQAAESNAEYGIASVSGSVP